MIKAYLSRISEYIPKSIKLIFNVYILGLVLFTIFRTFLYFSANEHAADVSITTLLKAFFMGFRFDTVISGYLITLPFLILFIFSIFKFTSRVIKISIFTFIFTLYSISFMICAMDIKFFEQFFMRFNVMAFEWFDSFEFVVKMVFQDLENVAMLIPLTIMLIVFYKRLSKIFNKYYTVDSSTDRFQIRNITLSVLFLGVMVLGIRGRTTIKSPIRVGTAYFCDNTFVNKLGLNPVFTLIKSSLNKMKEKDKALTLLNNDVAIKNVRDFLNITDTKFSSPIAREVKTEGEEKRKNVVIVIMESMSAQKMARYGNKNNITPFLDSLANHSYTFDNIYSAGIHTYNGIYSTTCSHPAIFGKHSMKGVNLPKFNGIANTLKKKNYTTSYFCTHDSQFDNAGGFLFANDYSKIVSQKDYPTEEVKTTLGVPDDYLFRFSMPIINDMAKDGKPFLSVFMTASDHSPNYIPEYFTSTKEKKDEKIVEYADWSLRKFMKLSSQQEWFDNTIFVFVADHGAIMSPTYNMPLSYNHVPMIVYSPKDLPEPKSFDHLGGQIDIFPTVMGLLNIPYVNNTFGVDLLKEKRPYMYFSADNKFGVIDDEFYYVSNNDGQKYLYKYLDKDTKNYIDEYKTKADSMDMYGVSNIQAADWIRQNNNTDYEGVNNSI